MSSSSGSLAYLGMTVSYLPVGTLAARLGRKPSMILTSIPVLMGWLLMALSCNSYMILAGRLVMLT